MTVEEFIHQHTAGCGSHEINRMARDLSREYYKYSDEGISKKRFTRTLRKMYGSRWQSGYETIPRALAL